MSGIYSLNLGNHLLFTNILVEKVTVPSGNMRFEKSGITEVRG